MSNIHVLPAANENISVKELSRKYQTLELSPHGLPHRSKAPTFDFTQGDWSHTVAEGMNIGCRLNDLVDIDVDLHSAGRLLAAFAPTGFVFGRQGAPATHHLFRVDGAVAKPISYSVTQEFAEKYLPKKPNGDPKVTIVEIRTGKLQTVFPPSTHEGGEAIRFETAGNKTFDGDPATLSFAELKRVAGLVAFAGVLSYIWPSSGSRQWAVVASVGVMRKYFKATNEEIRPYMASREGGALCGCPHVESRQDC